MIFDYDTLKLIWWLFVGVLLIGFALLDGFDLGIGALLPFIGRSDTERRVIINTIGPTWEGNQVWFVTAGGALFAAWPMVYAAAFSGLYVALLLVLFALFFRPVGFDYRSKIADPRWRTFWDWGMFAGGLVPAVVFGVAFGNLFLGLPFRFDDTLRPFYEGRFFELLSPFALLVGLVSLGILVNHGALYLAIKTEGVIQRRARRAAHLAAPATAVAFILAGAWLAFGIDGLRIVSMPDPAAEPAVLAKTVVSERGAWLDNYLAHPALWSLPVSAIAGFALSWMWSARGRDRLAFAASAATSSHLTLQLMFWAVLIFLPIISAYTTWVYRVMRGKVTERQVEEQRHTLY